MHPCVINLSSISCPGNQEKRSKSGFWPCLSIRTWTWYVRQKMFTTQTRNIDGGSRLLNVTDECWTLSPYELQAWMWVTWLLVQHSTSKNNTRLRRGHSRLFFKDNPATTVQVKGNYCLIHFWRFTDASLFQTVSWKSIGATHCLDTKIKHFSFIFHVLLSNTSTCDLLVIS